ncbi:protein SLX4IP isoform X2 [Hyla sarda]|uniref:protein SLX4IP isoform X2 n=1 Tax=Hyla sarda TaxID=327740 RepID=UPI0024C2A93F|nr:protein SLX4IP isoform X2 [Hyla sarda]
MTKRTRLRIAAYFIKRWVNLRCVVQRQFRELYVFPDRFVVCVSQLEALSNTWAAEAVKSFSMKESSSGTSEYFAEHRECEINNILSATLTKQAVLKNIVKKTKAATDSSPESGRDCKACPRLGLGDSDKGSKINTQSEPQCRSADQAKDCVNISQNNLELPDGEVENDFNSRQPCRTSSQHKPQSAAWLQTQDPTKALSWICESALPEQKQTLRTSIMQQKRRRCSSEGKSTVSCKKADLRDDTFRRLTEDPVDPSVLRDIKKLPVGDATESMKPKIVTDEHDKMLPMASYSTCEEKNPQESKKPTGGPPRKLKLQRPKKGPSDLPS